MKNSSNVSKLLLTKLLRKNLLTSELVLAYPNFEKDIELMTDISNFAIGAVLCPYNHHICYASSTLNSSEINFSVFEKKLLTILYHTMARPYLFDR